MQTRELLGYLRPRLVGATVRDTLDAVRWQARLRRLAGKSPHVDAGAVHAAAAPTFLPLPEAEAACGEAGDGEQPDTALADEFRAHRFTLLGSPLGGAAQLPWHQDWAAGFTYDQLPTRLLRRRVAFSPGFDRGVDYKRPWEVGRLQHLPCLALAAEAAGPADYAKAALADVEDFVRRNPPGRGIQWFCTMDVAIRAANLAWTLSRLGLAGEDGARSPFAHELLLVHGQFIERHLETRGTIANHYLADLAGLVFLGWALGREGAGAKWWRFGLDELNKQVLRQFNADGSNFEASLPYHRLALELTLYPLAIALAHGEKLPHEVEERLARALKFVAYYTQPDGRAPAVGDGDDGRLLVLSRRSFEDKNWHEYLLSAGAVALGSSDLAHLAGGCHAETRALMGPAGARRFAELAAAAPQDPSELGSRAFADGGLYVMRHKDLHMTVRAGSVGQEDNGGHAHNDVLSVTLHALGHPWIVDSGTGSYTDDHARRNRSRSTRAHNTIMVDGREMRPLGAHDIFALPETAHPHVRRWETTTESDRFEAEHYGYTRLPAKVVHRRAVVFDKRARTWSIDDLLDGSGQHTAEFFLHLATDDVRMQSTDANAIVVRATRAGVGTLVARISVEGPDALEVTPALSEALGYPSYNVAERLTLLTMRVTGGLPLAMSTQLSLETDA